MIKIENLSKKYDKELVLNNLNCTINDGCIYGLVGANGAGKSTLLRLINGIFKADSGSILIDNNEVFDNETVKQNLVFVPDDLFFYSGYTLLDTAKYYESMYKKFDMEYLKHLAGILKLDINRKISTLSKGMKRQCALICAIATHSKYMFFDETFDGLDPVIRNTMKKILAKQMEENNTTIVIYNLVFSFFLQFIMVLEEVKTLKFTNSNVITEKNRVETFILLEFFLNLGRIIGYLLLLITGLFFNVYLLEIVIIILVFAIILETNNLIKFN